MKCLNCVNEAVGRSKYCGDKCKVGYNRNKNRSKSVTSVTVNESVTGVESLSASQLYLAIHNYRQDTWKVSVEYKELMRRLYSMSIEELKVGGYNVPCWKYSEAA